MKSFFGNTKKIILSLIKTIRLHFINIILLVIIILSGVFFGWEKTANQKPMEVKNFIYLDPVDTAFAVENLARYTANINENLNYIEDTLFFNQQNSDEYLSKSLDSKLVTQQTKLEREYTVADGDSITSVAEKFDMHVGTIYQRNSLTADNIENLRPGDTLIIPAYDQTDSKEWLIALNDKKEVERQRLLALQQQQLLQQQKQKQQQLALANQRATYYRDSTDGRIVTVNTSGSNSYPYGWCTYYVASRRNVPSQWGNAGSWLYSASASGYATGSAPQAGAIIVTGESGYGHVGIVESASGGSVTISEMNYNGWGVTSSRTISTGSPVIKGYIY